MYQVGRNRTWTLYELMGEVHLSTGSGNIGRQPFSTMTRARCVFNTAFIISPVLLSWGFAWSGAAQLFSILSTAPCSMWLQWPRVSSLLPHGHMPHETKRSSEKYLHPTFLRHFKDSGTTLLPSSVVAINQRTAIVLDEMIWTMRSYEAMLDARVSQPRHTLILSRLFDHLYNSLYHGSE